MIAVDPDDVAELVWDHMASCPRCASGRERYCGSGAIVAKVIRAILREESVYSRDGLEEYLAALDVDEEPTP